jgi:hypothetical protein
MPNAQNITETHSQHWRNPIQAHNQNSLKRDNIMNATNDMCASSISKLCMQCQKPDSTDLYQQWRIENFSLAMNPTCQRIIVSKSSASWINPFTYVMFSGLALRGELQSSCSVKLEHGELTVIYSEVASLSERRNGVWRRRSDYVNLPEQQQQTRLAGREGGHRSS